MKHLIALLALFIPMAFVRGEAPAKPNFVFILIDDLG